jgi:mutator protein MutT
VAAALVDAAGRILIAQRPPGSHLAGGWEFPGGKLEPGETPLAGLARELHEEIGVDVGEGPHQPLGRVRHAYADREILIQAWTVTDFAGEPHGREGQELKWCAKNELAHASLLPADAPLVDALMLPERLTLGETEVYALDERRPGKLLGVTCKDLPAAQRAEDAEADFVVIPQRLSDQETEHLCAALHVPVYLKGRSLESAWVLGATGISELPPRT